jgi:hypothetical protein
VRREWPGAAEIMVTVDGAPVRALAYPALVGSPRPGDRVLLNVSALELGLGTGGYAFVVALPDRLPPDVPSPGVPSGDGTIPEGTPPQGPSPDGSQPAGHIVKSRYTPLQAMVASADEQGSPYHEVLREASSLEEMPVVVADLHSALPAILCGLFGQACPPPFRVAYVMQDGGALPAWFSRTAAGLRAAGWLAGTVTTGQSFGGDVEAVTVHTGLLAARHVLGADAAVIAQGPGNLGTGTAWGFSGVAAGEAVNAVAALHGRPVASLRLSFADPRPRHQGISHHSLTAYGRVALAAADVAVPALAPPRGARIAGEAALLGGRHRLVTVPVDGLEDALRACPVPLSTMGRGLAEDLEYFLAAAAAGRHAASLLRGAERPLPRPVTVSRNTGISRGHRPGEPPRDRRADGIRRRQQHATPEHALTTASAERPWPAASGQARGARGPACPQAHPGALPPPRPRPAPGPFAHSGTLPQGGPRAAPQARSRVRARSPSGPFAHLGSLSRARSRIRARGGLAAGGGGGVRG